MLDEKRQGLGLAERQPQPLQLVAPLEHAPDGLGRAARIPGQARDLRVHVRLADGQLLPRGDGLEEERPAHRALGVRPQLGRELLIVPADGVRIDPLPAQALAGVPDPVRDLADDKALGHHEVVARQRGVHDGLVERLAILPLPIGHEPRPDRVPELGERIVRPQAPGELVVDRRHFLLLHLDHPQRELARPPPELLARMPLGEPHLDPPLRARLETDHGLVHLGKHPTAADLEGVALLGARLARLRPELVVDHHEVAHARRARRGHERGPLLRERGERPLDVGIGHRPGRVPRGHAAVLAERDRGLDLDDRGEAERLPFLELELAKLRVLDGPELRLVHGPAVDRRNQRLGDRLPDLVPEPGPHERQRHLAPAEAGKPGVSLDPAARGRPGRPHFFLGRLDDQLALTGIELLNLDFHRIDRAIVLGEVWCERGELNPQGIAPTGS